MTPEERRDAQVRAIANTTSKRDRDIASEHLRDLLAYFDEQEPAVADAIRFGLLGAIDTGHVGYAINYPKGHPKNP